MTYNKEEFENLINDILHKAGYEIDIEIWLLIDQNAKKWYDKKYKKEFEFIEENTIYGIKYRGEYGVMYSFKSGKIDNLLKAFITTFSNKHKILVQLENGTYDYKVQKEKVQKTIIENNQDRVSKGLFYTTLYGIGFWAIFCSKQDIEVAKMLADYLKENSIQYHNEWSDAGWVYRFVIGNKVEVHNELLTKFKAK